MGARRPRRGPALARVSPLEAVQDVREAPPLAARRSFVPLVRRAALSSWVLGAVIAVVGAAPGWRPYPTIGLDSSWEAAIHMAARNRLEFGSGIDFTYGPLGFLAVPVLYFSSTGVLAALFSFGSRVAVCALVLRSSRRALALPVALVCTYVAGRSLQYVDNPQVLPLIPLLAYLTVLGPTRRAPSWVLPVAAGAGTAVLVLAKFNVGVVVLVMGMVAVWFAANRWRSVGMVLASFTAALLVGWLATGNSPAHLLSWMSASAEIASGYSTAMGLETTRGADVFLLVPALLVVIFGLWRGTTTWAPPRRAAAAVLVGLFVFAAFKHGFVRHDDHALGFFGVMPALFLGLGVSGRKAVAGFVVLVLLLLFAADGYSYRALLDPRPSFRTFRSLAADVISPGRRGAAIEASRKAQRDLYAIDPVTMSALQGRTVHVDPWETSTMWAFPELDWRPLPVFHSYSAYTAALDERNAEALTGKGAPQRILRETPRSVDGRNADFESPAATLAMLCNYRQLSAGDKWQVLGRVPTRCGAPMPAGSVRVGPGDRVEVPRSPAGTPALMFARVRGLNDSLVSAAVAFIYKGPETYMETDDGSRFRLVPDTADGPLLMAASPELGFLPTFGFARQVHSFSVTARRTLGLNRLGDIEVEFFWVPLHS